MSITALVWIIAFVLFAGLSLVRPAWGAVLYFLTFYMSPHFWWWGKVISQTFGDRINLVAAIIFAISVFMNLKGPGGALQKRQASLLWFLLFYAINATFVHFFLAANPPRSLNGLILVWKQLFLVFLMVQAIRTRRDFNLIIATILLGSLYIGLEAVLNDRGHFTAGRLEGLRLAGVGDSNYMAGLLALMVPLAGGWLFVGSRSQKLLAFLTLLFGVEVILRCNSRGGFLALIIGGVYLVLAASGRARRLAIYGVGLGCIAAFFMINNEVIIERFLTVFAKKEERDGSAQSRLDYAKAAGKMIADYPLGSGAEAAFKSNRGYKYIRPLGEQGQKAVHNGYADIAAAWGIQGALIYGLVLFKCLSLLRSARKRAQKQGDASTTFMGVCLESAIITQLIACAFLSSLDGEWFFWCFALAIGYDRAYVATNPRMMPVAPVNAVRLERPMDPIPL